MNCTKDKITQAAEQLFAEKGYDGVTTKEIANKANVSEVTLFRNFDNKRNLFEYILKEKMHPYGVKVYLEKEAVFDLEKDLKAMADMIFETYKKNLPLIRMLFKDNHHTKEHIRAKGHDSSFKNSLKDYFINMHEQGKIADNPDKAMKFFLLNITAVLSETLFRQKKEINEEYYIWMVSKVIEALKVKK
jgi:TetR/AcrR family transcriptional regulator, mexJK operon transcriptional repressor